MIMASIFLSTIFLSLDRMVGLLRDWINIARPVVRFSTLWKGKKGR